MGFQHNGTDFTPQINGVEATEIQHNGTTIWQSDGGGSVEDADYYVSADGSDANPGTEAEPFATVSAGLEALANESDPSGSLVYVKDSGGTISDSGTNVTINGSSGNRARVEAYPGHDPTVDWGGVGDTWGAAVNINACSYLNIEGITFQNSGGYGLYTHSDSHNVTIRNCTTLDCGNTGIYFYLDTSVADNLLVEHCRSAYHYDGGENSDGFAVGREDTYGGPVTFRYCEAHNNEDDGFDLWATDESVIEYCLSHSNGRDANGNVNGNGNGYKMAGGDGPNGENGGNYLYKSVAYDNEAHGVRGNETTGGLPHTIYNVTSVYNGGVDYDLWEHAHEVRNCVATSSGESVGSATDDQYNNWNLGIDSLGLRSSSLSDWEWWGDAGDAFRLTSSSNLLNQGTDVGFSYTDSGPDLGAFERGLADEDPV